MCDGRKNGVLTRREKFLFRAQKSHAEKTCFAHLPLLRAPRRPREPAGFSCPSTRCASPRVSIRSKCSKRRGQHLFPRYRQPLRLFRFDPPNSRVARRLRRADQPSRIWPSSTAPGGFAPGRVSLRAPPRPGPGLGCPVFRCVCACEMSFTRIL